jgi:hypothetical protein
MFIPPKMVTMGFDPSPNNNMVVMLSCGDGDE